MCKFQNTPTHRSFTCSQTWGWIYLDTYSHTAFSAIFTWNYKGKLLQLFVLSLWYSIERRGRERERFFRLFSTLKTSWLYQYLICANWKRCNKRYNYRGTITGQMVSMATHGTWWFIPGLHSTSDSSTETKLQERRGTWIQMWVYFNPLLNTRN